MTTIDFTWSTPEWTEADSEALDDAILAERERRNPPKREVHKRPESCLHCNKKLLPFGVKSKPGHVRHQGRGLCSACYDRSRRTGKLA